MIENNQLFPIGVVERDTGIGRDTLRVWERRYGFPDPGRKAKGERVYPEIQLRRLRKLPAGVTRFNSLETLPFPAEAPVQRMNYGKILRNESG